MWLRGHAEQEIAAERDIMASGSEETTRSKRRSRMPRERELGRWCKTSPQMLSDPKSRAARSFSSFLGRADADESIETPHQPNNAQSELASPAAPDTGRAR